MLHKTTTKSLVSFVDHGEILCVSLFYVIDTGSIGSRARIEMGVTYLPLYPITFDSQVAAQNSKNGFFPRDISRQKGYWGPYSDPTKSAKLHFSKNQKMELDLE